MLTNPAFYIWVGDDALCPMKGEFPSDSRWSGLLHAAKHPCHVGAVGYTGSLPKDHPEYLVAVRDEGRQLYLNIVDAPVPIFRHEVFTAALDFLDVWAFTGPVLVHCNNGLSRAPSLVLAWLAKRGRKDWADMSFAEARAAFERLMPDYAPGKGIEQFLVEEWGRIT